MMTLPAAQARTASAGRTLEPRSALGPGETGSAVEAALLAGLAPRDEAERYMIVQMAVVHEAVLDCAEQARCGRSGPGGKAGGKPRRRRPRRAPAGSAARQGTLHLAARLMGVYARQMATLDQHRALGEALARAREAQALRAEAARARVRFEADAAKTRALEAQWLQGLALVEAQLAAEGAGPEGRSAAGAGDRLPLPRPELSPEQLAEPEAAPEAAPDPIDPQELEDIAGPAELAALLERAAAGAADPATMDRLLKMAEEWVEGDDACSLASPP